MPELALGAEESLAMDRWLVARGFSIPALMAAAGARVAEAARRLLRERGLARAVFLVGPGNNGGDALVAERLLRGETETVMWQPLPRPAGAEAVSEEAGALAETYERPMSVVRRSYVSESPADLSRGITEPPSLDARTLVVDGLFGVGLQRLLEGRARAAVEHVNASRAVVLAIDIPSGLSADDGAVLGAAVRAHETVSFVLPKRGLRLGAGPAHAGVVRVVEIGFPAREAEAWARERRGAP
jgi:ADP-dependent NAD(P)H-hydrate dehydratase / NAD(P)H-hydrate epimerase